MRLNQQKFNGVSENVSFKCISLCLCEQRRLWIGNYNLILRSGDVSGESCIGTGSQGLVDPINTKLSDFCLIYVNR